MFLTRTSVKKLQKKKSLWNMFRKTPKVLQEDHKKEERECSDEHGESVKTQKTLSQRKEQMKLHQTDQCMDTMYSSTVVPVWVSTSSDPENEILVYALHDDQSVTTFIMREASGNKTRASGVKALHTFIQKHDHPKSELSCTAGERFLLVKGFSPCNLLSAVHSCQSRIPTPLGNSGLDYASIGAWMLAKQHWSIEESACMNRCEWGMRQYCLFCLL